MAKETVCAYGPKNEYYEWQTDDPRLQGMQRFSGIREVSNHEREDNESEPFVFYTVNRERAEQLIEGWNERWDGDYSFTLDD